MTNNIHVPCDTCTITHTYIVQCKIDVTGMNFQPYDW
jgi:hypothetical protein